VRARARSRAIRGRGRGEEALPGVAVVRAAQRGDREALDRLAGAYLPLVYNIVGRALGGHPDVDDLVQETLLRAVGRIGELRDPERFRGWVVAIAMHQVRDRWRARQAVAQAQGPGQGHEPHDVIDPGSDFVGVTILRLGLAGQRQETAEATRWLEDEERGLLSLWWQEAAGQLSRAELAEAAGLSPAHAGVRVQRMKARLDTARRVVRALRARPRCPELAGMTAGWNGVPSSLWRKRLARHVRECAGCEAHALGMAPAEGLLAGLALVPLPVGYVVATQLLAGAGAGAGASAGAGATAGAGVFGKLAGAFAAKPALAAATGATVIAAGIGAYTLTGPPRGEEAGPPPPSLSQAPPSPDPTEVIVGEAPPPTVQNHEPSPAATPQGPVYGQTVDVADALPPAPGTPPGPLPERPEGTPVTEIGGVWLPPNHGPADGWLLTHRDEHVVLSGQGYFLVRWQIGWVKGPMTMPTWTGLEGELFHVASGGGRRMDDVVPGSPEGYTLMGSPETGYTVLPEGAQQMWQNEYFYLDGTVTLTNHQRADREHPADYGFVVSAVTHEEVVADITTVPHPDGGPVRYGIVRDTTGDDAAPVPQYLTRARPEYPAFEVAQLSDVLDG
jgi:RNA polymerase sigma factor (sigma-70 family)